jgi:two-component system NtrC family sensor kinase
VIRLNRALANLLGIRLTDAIGWDVCRLKLLASSAVPGHCPLCRNANSIEDGFVYQTGERTYLVSTSRVDASEDSEPRTIHVLKDVTERREADRRYRRERDFNKNILNNTQSMILVLDTAGLISYANRRCADAGYGEEKLLGRPLVEMVPPACRHVLSRALSATLEGTAIENMETPLLRGNSTEQFQISLSPMRDEQGEINSVVVVMSDITEAVNLQAKLMHSEKMAALGQLVSGVAHEVNNPLAAIVGFTDLLLENPAVPEAAKEDLHVILQEAQRTRVIVQNLLSFARQMPAQREPVQINTVLRQTLKLRAYDFANNGIDLSESYHEELPLIVGDPNQLQQVFLNIINNAYDAIQEGRSPGKIQIMTSHNTEQLEISFWNSGPAITNPDRIFDPFFTTKEVGKGTGLGLSICYGIIRAHGGEIVARNEPGGDGCEFLVRLPVATVNSPAFQVSKATQQKPLDCDNYER